MAAITFTRDNGEREPVGNSDQVPAYRVCGVRVDAHQRRAHVALVGGHDPKDGVLRVQDHDPQLLALQAAHLQDEAVRDVAR